MALSPDETKLAVHASYGRGFLIRDLETDAEQPISLLEPNESWQINGLQWLPDGQHLLLFQEINSCSPDIETAVIRIDIDTLSAFIILEPNKRQFTLLEWIQDGEVKLQDETGQIWYPEIFSGELASLETAVSAP